MSVGLLGKKLGMTQRYDAQGRRMAVTVLQLGPCTVVRVEETSGTRKAQLGYGAMKEKNMSKAEQGHLKKAGVAHTLRHLREFRLDERTEALTVGQEVDVSIFAVDEYVDVTADSIGRGFQGGMRRWGWSGGPAAHGSRTHRRIGSMGQTTTPGRVLRGHPEPGRMGGKRRTVQNLRVIEVLPEQHALLVHGSVPGSESSLVMVRKALKRHDKYVAAVSQSPRGLGDKKAKIAGRKK
jgi:large subunit ribosomal protein L3